MRRTFGIVAFGFLVGIGAVAQAEDAPAAAPVPEKLADGTAPNAKTADGDSLAVDKPINVRPDALRSDAKSVITIDASKVPLEQKTRNVESMLGEQRGNLNNVSSHLRQARDGRDIVQVNCVSEKLTGIKGLLRISEVASIRMFDAIANDQPGEINHNYSQVAVAHQRSQLLNGESDTCVGAQSGYTGKTDVKVDIDSDVPQSNPSLAAFEKFAPGLMPPIASDF